MIQSGESRSHNATNIASTPSNLKINIQPCTQYSQDQVSAGLFEEEFASNNDGASCRSGDLSSCHKSIEDVSCDSHREDEEEGPLPLISNKCQEPSNNQDQLKRRL